MGTLKICAIIRAYFYIHLLSSSETLDNKLLLTLINLISADEKLPGFLDETADN